MELHEFYRKYANIPLSGENSRNILRGGEGDEKMSPMELWQEITNSEYIIKKEKQHIENMLRIADKLIK